MFFRHVGSSAASLLAAAVLAMAPAHAEPAVQTRIVGGSVVQDGALPWMASVYFQIPGTTSFAPGCGGTVIADRWILTAAHCVTEGSTTIDANTVAVKLGVNDITVGVETPTFFDRVSRIIVHPDYVPATFLNDVALLELPRAVGITPISLPSAFESLTRIGETATGAGWGTTSSGGAISLRLLAVNLPIATTTQCASQYAGLNDVAMLCAGGRAQGGRDTCQGDSGGPLFVSRGGQYVQNGIVSFGAGCALPNVPGVYARVSAYRAWIDSHVTGTVTYQASSPSNSIVTTLPLNGVTSAVVRENNMALYRVRGGDRVTLNSLSGDADLYVYSSEVITSDNLICESIALGAAEDSCAVPNTAGFNYIAVQGYEDSTYSLSVTGDVPVTPQGDVSGGGGGGGVVGFLVYLVALLRVVLRPIWRAKAVTQ